MTDIAEAEPMTTATLVIYAQAGRSWVAVDDRDCALGYVVVDLIDGCAHVEQISVDPDHQGHGLGWALPDEVERWAAARNLRGCFIRLR
ncbi:MAG: GNAT family N-acetyltransferase [Acidimicrobiales bacterium]